MKYAWHKLIVALDVVDEKRLQAIVRALAPRGVVFKVGLITFTAFGPEIIRTLVQQRARVFVDLKLYDIPNTMAECAKELVRLGAWAFTVHARAGSEALRYVKKEIIRAARLHHRRRPLMIGVTELTSNAAGQSAVLQLAKVAKRGGCDGVVCSVWEAKRIKERYRLRTITPGIRKKEAGDDQKRVATVAEALANKVDYFVVGRPIVMADDYLRASLDILTP